MRIDIITVQPYLLDGPFAHSILKRAQEKGIAKVVVHDLRDFGLGRHKQVDDMQFGGGAGMVMMIVPIEAIIEQLKAERSYDEIIFMTPDGVTFNQNTANNLSLKTNLILLCGHYKGIDERIRDYVLSGGELAAAVVSDAIIRLLPGVLNDETSALSDSFQDDLLAPPVYTRPSEYKGMKVPDVLLSGNFKAIDIWRQEQAESRTKTRRPDIWNKKDNSEE
jgi:tRNA (guanine37-N1)-methyltransferase